MNARMLTGIRWLCGLYLVCFIGCQSNPAKKKDEGPQKNDPAARAQVVRPDEVPESKVPEILPQTHLTAGKLHESQGHLARAIEQYRQVLAIDPTNLEAQNRLGIVLDRMGRFKEADEAFAQAIKQAPNEAYLHNNLAFSYTMQARWKDAEAELTEALRNKPDFARARVNFGMVLAQQERFDEAMAQFELALPREDAYYNMGLMYQSKRRLPDAAVAFKKALKQNPKLVAAQKRLDALPPDVVKAATVESAVLASPQSPVATVAPAPEKRTPPVSSQPAKLQATTQPSHAARQDEAIGRSLVSTPQPLPLAQPAFAKPAPAARQGEALPATPKSSAAEASGRSTAANKPVTVDIKQPAPVAPQLKAQPAPAMVAAPAETHVNAQPNPATPKGTTETSGRSLVAEAKQATTKPSSSLSLRAEGSQAVDNKPAPVIRHAEVTPAPAPAAPVVAATNVPKPVTAKPSQAVDNKPAPVIRQAEAKPAPAQATVMIAGTIIPNTVTIKPSSSLQGPGQAKPVPAHPTLADIKPQKTTVPPQTAAKPIFRPLDDQWWDIHSPLAAKRETSRQPAPMDCTEPVASDTSVRLIDINCAPVTDEYDARYHIVRIWRSLATPPRHMFDTTPECDDTDASSASPYPPFGPEQPGAGTRNAKPKH